jgi:hypothetical protein
LVPLILPSATVALALAGEAVPPSAQPVTATTEPSAMPGEPARLLFRRAERDQRFGRRERLHQRDRREAAPGFLGEDARGFGRHADPAVRLGDARRGPAEIDDRLPQRRVKARCPVHRRARHRGSGAVVEELARLLAQCLGVVGKVEVHAISPERFCGSLR